MFSNCLKFLNDFQNKKDYLLNPYLLSFIAIIIIFFTTIHLFEVYNFFLSNFSTL